MEEEAPQALDAERLQVAQEDSWYAPPEITREMDTGPEIVFAENVDDVLAAALEHPVASSSREDAFAALEI